MSSSTSIATDSDTHHDSRRRLTWALVVAVATAILIATLLPSLGAARQSARKMSNVSLLTAEQFLADSSPATSHGLGLSPQVADAAVPRPIVYQTTLSMVADTPADALRLATNVTQEAGGYIERSNLEGESPGPQTATAKLRVPANKRLDVIAALRQSATATAIAQETHRAEEVGDQLIDLQARLKQHRAAEEQLLNLLTTAQSKDGERATQHVLEVFRELNQIRETIERLDAQRHTLEQRVTYATIDLHIRSPKTIVHQEVEPWAPQSDVAHATKTLTDLGQSLIRLLIYALIVGVPIALPIAALIWVLHRLTKRLGAHAKSQTA